MKLNKKLIKIVAVLTMAFTLLATIRWPAAQAESGSGGAASVNPASAYLEGSYSVALSVYKVGGATPEPEEILTETNEKSVAADYVEPTATLNIEGGEAYATLTLKSSSFYQYLKIKSGGAYQDISLDVPADGDRKTVRFKIDDPAARVDAKIHIIVPSISYNEKYYIQYAFDTSAIPLKTGKLPDGVYSLDFQALHATKEQPSSMDGYFLGPKRLVVQGGKKYVTFTVKDNLTVQAVTYGAQGTDQYYDTLVTGVDPVNDTRTVQLQLDRVDQTIGGQVHIVTKNGDKPYDMWHAIRFKFDANSIKRLSGPAEPVLRDGVYSIGVAAKHATKEQLSGMNAYFLEPKRLAVKSGVKTVSFTVKDSSIVKNVQYAAGDGSFVEADTLSANESANTRIVEIPAAALRSELNGKVHIVMPLQGGQTYDMWHDIRYAFDADSIGYISPLPVANGEYDITLASLPDEAKTYFKSGASLKADNGKYLVTFKLNAGAALTKLRQAGSLNDILPYTGAAPQAIAEVRTLALAASSDVQFEIPDLTAAYTGYVKVDGESSERTFAFQLQVTEKETPGNPGNPGNPGDNGVQDGYYQISYTILHTKEDAPSVMDGYVTHPGVLQVSGGSKTVYIQLQQSKEITSFKVENGGSLAEASTAYEDKQANTRWVRFPVAALNTTLNGWVNVNWPAMNYYHSYDVRIKLGSAGAATSNPIPDSPVGGTPGGGKDGTKGDKEEEGGKQENGGNTPEVKLTDIANHWAKDAIERAVKLGIVGGYANGTFVPGGEVTRAEFTAMLVRALGLDTAEAGELTLKDKDQVPAWAKGYVSLAVARGIVGGYEDGTFRAGGKISRAELTVMIVRALGLPVEQAPELTFADAGDIPAWARPYVAVAFKEGLVSGRGQNKFAPVATATRAEAVTLVLKLLDYKKS
ncbi:NEAT domain-containing protein [Cohnella sp. 56]|uniref:NEAT domain-containing protein n=1 Tax=Cohnella sp. 56 TaxID=3113722 RepID=UPI0030E9279B